MPAHKDRPTIENDAQYEALKKLGYSKEKAARISNTPNAGKRGGKAKDYEDRTKAELYKKAKQVGIEGRSKMSKGQLIRVLRSGQK